MSNKIAKVKYSELINYLFKRNIISDKELVFLVNYLKNEDVESVKKYLLSLRCDNYSRMKILDVIGGRKNEEFGN